MNKPFCATVEVPDGCKIHSLVGLRGSATNWVDGLKHRDWNNLVEEGPLTQLGHSTLVWKKAEILSKEYEVAEIPKKSGAKVEDKKKRKGRTRKGGKKK